METPALAEAFPVGEFLAEELEARGWSTNDFAEILGFSPSLVEGVISGEQELSREMAVRIGAALGTSTELWLNLQNTYLLWKLSQDDEVQERLVAVRRRARTRELTDTRG